MSEMEPGYTYGQENPFPAAGSVYLVKVGRRECYRTPHGDMKRTTNVLRALGLKTEGLVRWSASVEREAMIAAAAEVFAGGQAEDVQSFIDLIWASLPAVKEGERRKTEAGDLGTSAHDEIRRRTLLMLGAPAPAEMPLRIEAAHAVEAWERWMHDEQITPFLAEQPVYHAPSMTAGTIDLLAYDRHGRLGIPDYKTSKAIYPDHHVQVAHYCRMARQWAPIEWASIVRLPKNVNDEAFEVVPLGHLDSKRTLTEEELHEVFDAANRVYDLLMAA